jgi:hypothetical protein
MRLQLCFPVVRACVDIFGFSVAITSGMIEAVGTLRLCAARIGEDGDAYRAVCRCRWKKRARSSLVFALHFAQPFRPLDGLHRPIERITSLFFLPPSCFVPLIWIGS